MDMQIKTTVRYFKPTGLALIRRTGNSKCCQRCGEIGILNHCQQNVASTLGKSLNVPEMLNTELL